MSAQRVRCPLCTFGARDLEELIMHVSSHTGKRVMNTITHIFSCPCCTYWSGTLADVAKHFEELAAAGQLLDHVMHAATIHALTRED